MPRFPLALLALVPAAACADLPAKMPELGVEDACTASAQQHLVGRDESVLAAVTFPAPVRIIHPNQPVTMDVVPTRLNILVDGNGRITRIYCG